MENVINFFKILFFIKSKQSSKIMSCEPQKSISIKSPNLSQKQKSINITKQLIIDHIKESKPLSISLLNYIDTNLSEVDKYDIILEYNNTILLYTRNNNDSNNIINNKPKLYKNKINFIL